MNSLQSSQPLGDSPQEKRKNSDGGTVDSLPASEKLLLDALLANSLDLIYFKDVNSRFVRYSRSLALHQGVFDPGALHEMIRDHMERRVNIGYHLWGLLTLFLWMRRWGVEAPYPRERGERAPSRVFAIQ